MTSDLLAGVGAQGVLAASHATLQDIHGLRLRHQPPTSPAPDLARFHGLTSLTLCGTDGTSTPALPQLPVSLRALYLEDLKADSTKERWGDEKSYPLKGFSLVHLMRLTHLRLAGSATQC